MDKDSYSDINYAASNDTRNVIDKYKGLSVDAIRADLDRTRSGLHVAIENWEHDFNIGSIVRTANAFNVGGVHIIGRRHWNRRGAMVTDRYLDVFHHPDVGAFVSAMNGREIIAVDNLAGAVPLKTSSLPRDCVLVFGSEGTGLSREMQTAASRMVMIEQAGSTRSLNAGAAAAIVMYQWQSQNYL